MFTAKKEMWTNLSFKGSRQKSNHMGNAATFMEQSSGNLGNKVINIKTNTKLWSKTARCDLIPLLY
jgi:hypothetical protein